MLQLAHRALWCAVEAVGGWQCWGRELKQNEEPSPSPPSCLQFQVYWIQDSARRSAVSRLLSKIRREIPQQS